MGSVSLGTCHRKKRMRNQINMLKDTYFGEERWLKIRQLHACMEF